MLTQRGDTQPRQVAGVPWAIGAISPTLGCSQSPLSSCGHAGQVVMCWGTLRGAQGAWGPPYLNTIC